MGLILLSILVGVFYRLSLPTLLIMLPRTVTATNKATLQRRHSSICYGNMNQNKRSSSVALLLNSPNYIGTGNSGLYHFTKQNLPTIYGTVPIPKVAVQNRKHRLSYSIMSENKQQYWVHRRRQSQRRLLMTSEHDENLTTKPGDQHQQQPISNSKVIPRAAVSVAVRVQFSYHEKVCCTFYLLIQRGTEPNIGMWSLPGGKIEYGETTLQAAQRELDEETRWSTPFATVPSDQSFETDAVNILSTLRWVNETVLTTDAIGTGYHYVIAHYFAEYPTINCNLLLDPLNIRDDITISSQPSLYDNINNTFAMSPLVVEKIRHQLPIITASDDASDAQWYTIQQIQDMESCGTTTPGIYRVIQRMEILDQAKLL
jgi:ADP-ribose pyrophosphatase YjhB (NUDIX family)